MRSIDIFNRIILYQITGKYYCLQFIKSKYARQLLHLSLDLFFMNNRRNILNKEVAEQKLHRLALEVAESLSGDNAPLVLIGVRHSGTVVAEKIASYVKSYIDIPVEVITISFDKHVPREITLSKDIDFTDKNVLVVDDVTNSGKTLLYALKPLLSFYPRRIQTLVLIERMHKLFPIKPDYVGLSIATTMEDHIHVEVINNEVTGAYIQ